jgi:hypothetical protein
VGVIGHFRNDGILMWDLTNKPDNDNPPYKAEELADKDDLALRLLKEEWKWAHRTEP